MFFPKSLINVQDIIKNQEKFMRKNLSNSLAALAIVVFAALGCNMSKNGGATNGGANSSGNNTVAANTPDAAPPSAVLSSRSIAWNLANTLTSAAILYDKKGVETSDALTKAKILAQEVGANIPPFPAKTGDRTKDTSAIIGYLMSGFEKIGDKINKKYGREEAGLFEMSLKSNVLLLFYGPGEKEGKTIARLIRSHAQDARLPENLWLPAVEKIEANASFDAVKDAILAMQADVGNYLGNS